MASQSKKSSTRRKAVTVPVSAPGKVWPFWDRAFEGMYRAYAVRVVGRKGDLVRFTIWNGQKELSLKGKPFTVDLTDGTIVWGDLPSTAQLVKPGSDKPWGLLFLTDAWVRPNAGRPVIIYTNGTKWPKDMGL